MNPPLAESAPLVPLVRDRKGGLPFGVVALVFVALLAIGLTVASFIHGRYVGFERVAARHVAPDAAFVLRWDVEKVSLFEPTRRFLLPLLDANAPAGATETRRERLTRAANLQVSRDLREVLVTFGPNAGDWAVVLAGSFPKGDVMHAVGGALQTEGVRSAGPSRVATANGVQLGRSEDGAFILAGNETRFDATLPSRAIPSTIERLGAGSFFLVPQRGGGLPTGAADVLAPLGDVAEVTGRADWGSPLRVELRLRYRGEPPADIDARVQRSLQGLFGADLARLEQRFGRFHAQPAGSSTVKVRLSLDDTALEQGADRAARAVLSGLALRPALD
jgi:hypothetical protein